MPPVLTLERNKKGRDFVIGDLHACYDLLQTGMKRVNFDPDNDRILSLGDLSDRGTKPIESARLIRESWFKAVRGNHEDVFLNIFADGVPHPFKLASWSHIGMQWIPDTKPEILQEILGLFRQLPIVMQVETARGMVGLVHAEVPQSMHWQTFINDIEAQNPDTTESALWGRERILSNDQSGVSGIDRVFVGHTIRNGGLKKYGNIYAVDTGAFLRDLNDMHDHGLTMVDVVTSTASLVRQADLHGSPVDIRADHPQPVNPFGVYATLQPS